MNTFFSRGDIRMTRVAMVAAAALYPLLSPTPPLVGWVRGAPLRVLGHTVTPARRWMRRRCPA